MKYLLFTIVLFFATHVIGQKSAYNHLDTLRNGDITKCVPCYYMEYSSGTLIWEGEQYSDCAIGNFKQYTADGTLWIVGQYKPNLSNDWSTYKGAIPVGKWTYIDEDGNTYYEFWDNGTFIKQVPEQRNPEVWKTLLKIKGEIIEPSTSLTDIPLIQIEPLFKNKSTDVHLTCRLSFSVVGKRLVEFTAKPSELAEAQIANSLKEANFSVGDKINCSLFIKYSCEESTHAFRLKVKY